MIDLLIGVVWTVDALLTLGLLWERAEAKRRAREWKEEER